MNEDIYWLKIVLRKLYSLHLEDADISGYYWMLEWDDYLTHSENLANCESEVKVLNALDNADVIELAIMDNHFPNRSSEITNKLTGAPKHFDKVPILVNFDFEKFSKYCSTISFNPSLDGRLAEFSLDSISPIVTIDEQTYTFNPLKDGSSVFKVIELCYQRDSIVTLDEIKQINPHISNVNQLLKAGPFDKDNGPLSCFLETTPKTIKLHKKATLTNKQLGFLKSKAIRKK